MLHFWMWLPCLSDFKERDHQTFWIRWQKRRWYPQDWKILQGERIRFNYWHLSNIFKPSEFSGKGE
jgi:hypothetical protein